jgi:hypothetical protein
MWTITEETLGSVRGDPDIRCQMGVDAVWWPYGSVGMSGSYFMPCMTSIAVFSGPSRAHFRRFASELRLIG